MCGYKNMAPQRPAARIKAAELYRNCVSPFHHKYNWNFYSNPGYRGIYIYVYKSHESIQRPLPLPPPFSLDRLLPTWIAPQNLLWQYASYPPYFLQCMILQYSHKKLNFLLVIFLLMSAGGLRHLVVSTLLLQRSAFWEKVNRSWALFTWVFLRDPCTICVAPFPPIRKSYRSAQRILWCRNRSLWTEETVYNRKSTENIFLNKFFSYLFQHGLEKSAPKENQEHMNIHPNRLKGTEPWDFLSWVISAKVPNWPLIRDWKQFWL